jgi:hypothetical protein
MRVCFTSNSEGDRWAWTEGLRDVPLAGELELPQAELGTPVPWPADELRDGQVDRLLTFVHRYLTRHSRPIRGGQTIRYGWTLLRTRPLEDEDGWERLALQELANPFAEQATSYIDGVRSAIDLLAIQEEAIRRNGITGTAEHPHRDDNVVVCARVDRGGSTPLTLTRQSLTQRRFHDSGWLAGCRERNHHHDDPEELQGAPLAHLVAAYSWIFPYLGMPAGTAVVREDAGIVVFRPDERRGALDDARPFALPDTAG